jgi:hypothetical protein
MTVSFSDKSSLKDILTDKKYKNILLRFSDTERVVLTRDILEFIRNFLKQNKSFIKPLISSKEQFIYLLNHIQNFKIHK